MIMGVERKWAPTMMKLDGSLDDLNGGGGGGAGGSSSGAGAGANANNDMVAANSGKETKTKNRIAN